MSDPIGSNNPNPAPSAPLMTVGRAAFYFGVVYFSQGICQTVTLLNQPLRLYLQKVAHFDAAGVSRFYFISTIPWMIKPIYGLLSDFFPIFGYRRKSYLLILNLLAAVAFMLVAGVTKMELMLPMLTLTAVGVGASDVVVDAMMVQTGQETGRTRLFQGAQWFSINVAAILSGILGAKICARYADQPATALKTAATIAMFVPFVVAALTWLLVNDRRTSINVAEFKATGKALLRAFLTPRLWLVVFFLFLVHFNPGVITGMYTFLEFQLGLPHAFLGVLDTINSCGQVVGALIFMLLLSGRISTKLTIAIGLLCGALGLLPMLAIRGATSAGVAYGAWGVTYIIASLAQLTVAAEACPRRVEAVVFAALMSVVNLSVQYSDLVGSKLYEGRLNHHIAPLVTASAALTAAGLLLVPFLRGARDDSADTAAASNNVH